MVIFHNELLVYRKYTPWPIPSWLNQVASPCWQFIYSSKHHTPYIPIIRWYTHRSIPLFVFLHMYFLWWFLWLYSIEIMGYPPLYIPKNWRCPIHSATPKSRILHRLFNFSMKFYPFGVSLPPLYHWFGNFQSMGNCYLEHEEVRRVRPPTVTVQYLVERNSLWGVFQATFWGFWRDSMKVFMGILWGIL